MIDLSQRESASRQLRRSYRTQFEVRSKPGGRAAVTGYATVYEEPYEMYDWLGRYDEVVRTGAGTKTLSESPMVQLLLNHTGLSMAYTSSGTLKLGEDSTGLNIDADVNITRTDVANMVKALEDRDVDEMSFAFRCTKQMWSPDYTQRDILEYDINRGDVSVVNFGANPATSVEASMRAADFDRMDETAARALYERLGARLGPARAAAPYDPDNDPLFAQWALVD